MRRLLLLLFVTSIGACNFADPVTFAESTCERDADCGDRGECVLANGRQLCQCDEGFDGTHCDECVPGREMVDGECVEENNAPNNANNVTPTNNVITPTNNTTQNNNPMCPVTQTPCGELCCAAGEICTDGACVELFVGRRCTDNAACGEGGFCARQQDLGIPGGYCSVYCDATTPCPDGAVCQTGGGACLAECDEQGMCGRSELQCGQPVPADPQACYPYGGGNKLIGDACASHIECPGDLLGRCDVIWPSGYCTQLCPNGDECPAGTHCSGNACRKDCATSRDCRPGYGCMDADFSGDLECAPAATGIGAVGAACASWADCAGGDLGHCLIGGSFSDNGYCSQTCLPGASPCPTGSVCVDAGFATICLQECVMDTDCGRPGFTCEPAGNFTACIIANP